MPSSEHDSLTNILWLHSCEGSQAALAQLSTVYYSSLYHYGTKFTNDRELIKDCLQDLFLEIWEKRDRMLEVRNPKSYLFQAFRNNLLYRTKNATRYKGITESDMDQLGTYSPEAEWISKEVESNLGLKLGQTFERLPKRQREAPYLRYYEDLSYDEIAEIMGLRRQAVANYIQYGIQKLRAYWLQSFISLLLFLT